MPLAILFLLFCFLLTPVSAEPGRWAVAIHGGAGASSRSLTPEQYEASQKALKMILSEAREFLEEGGSALECVEMTVVKLENSPHFNAGRGAVFNSEGGHELDASIMDGRDLRCGAVAGVRTVKNPVKLARRVMENTPHVLLAGEGAEYFAQESGAERVPNSYFSTERRRKDWERKRAYSKGTVGCVALDQEGNLAAATSTGGLTNKKWGRVGDSPIIGAGCYANNASCAFSGTGRGEEYIRRSLGHDVSARMLYGEQSLKSAAQAALESLPENCGGLICVDADGNVVLLFNTPGMARGAASSQGRFEVGIDP